MVHALCPVAGAVVRGFRLVGRLYDAPLLDVGDSDLVFFSPRETGEDMRTGWYKGHTFKREASTLAAWAGGGVCVDDYIFVATALGENCFK